MPDALSEKMGSIWGMQIIDNVTFDARGIESHGGVCHPTLLGADKGSHLRGDELRARDFVVNGRLRNLVRYCSHHRE